MKNGRMEQLKVSYTKFKNGEELECVMQESSRAFWYKSSFLIKKVKIYPSSWHFHMLYKLNQPKPSEEDVPPTPPGDCYKASKQMFSVRMNGLWIFICNSPSYIFTCNQRQVKNILMHRKSI